MPFLFIYPAVSIANRFRLRIDFRDITSKSSSSNCCFLNLKYSSIRHLIRYTFVTIWHRRSFSCILRLPKSSMGSVLNPCTATRVSSFAGNLHSFTGMQLILQFTALPLLSLKSMQKFPLYLLATSMMLLVFPL